MSEIKQVNDLFKNIFDDLNVRVRTSEDLYGCRLFQQSPTNPFLPNIQMYLSYTRMEIGNRDYTENKYPFDITVEIYTENLTDIKRRELGEVLEAFVDDFLANTVGMKLTFSRPVPILEERIHRIVMRYSGKYDIEQDKIYKE